MQWRSLFLVSRCNKTPFIRDKGAPVFTFDRLWNGLRALVVWHKQPCPACRPCEVRATSHTCLSPRLPHEPPSHSPLLQPSNMPHQPTQLLHTHQLALKSWHFQQIITEVWFTTIQSGRDSRLSTAGNVAVLRRPSWRKPGLQQQQQQYTTSVCHSPVPCQLVWLPSKVKIDPSKTLWKLSPHLQNVDCTGGTTKFGLEVCSKVLNTTCQGYSSFGAGNVFTTP